MSATGQMFQMTPPQSLADGTVVAGRYRVIGKLGEGGMGAVYRAIQEPLGREVALKVIAPALTKDADSVERFRREAKAASSLSHPNIVTVFDFGEDNGLLFLAMELIPGIGLDQAIRRGPMSPQRAIPILRGVCAALAEAHAHGIIHRDLKPQNIMLTSTSTQQDVVKVVDFGIARLADHGNAALTRTGAVVGTPGYVAPEFFDGAPASPMSDLYAVGVVAYELLAGVTPFPSG
jgi:eukaryotic-like serine/threonine-protein kinase